MREGKDGRRMGDIGGEGEEELAGGGKEMNRGRKATRE